MDKNEEVIQELNEFRKKLWKKMQVQNPSLDAESADALESIVAVVMDAVYCSEFVRDDVRIAYAYWKKKHEIEV